MQLSLRWGERSKRAFEGRAREGYALFGIVQGGDDPGLREQSARALTGIGFDGYAIGGLAVGEPQEVMLKIVAETAPMLPQDRPRYLMGVGTPDDLLAGGGARHRHVRLRAADPQRPPRHGVHAVRVDQSGQCAPRRRPAPARRAERASGRAHLFARLPASSDQGQRDPRPGAALDHQSRLLPGADGRHARGHCRRALRRFPGRHPGAVAAGRYCRRAEEGCLAYFALAKGSP